MSMKHNFKTIKDLSSKLLFESAVNVNSNFSYNKFLTEVKKSSILKTQFIVYTNIENENFTDRATADKFLQENIDLFKNFTKKEILDENEKLYTKLKYNDLYIINEDVVFDLILESTKDKKISGITKRAKLFTEVVNMLMENKEKVTEVTTSIDNKLPFKKVVKRATEILNEKYSFLSENELNILKAFINKDDAQKETLYNNLINENLKLVKRKLFEEEKYSSDEIESLILTEEKLKSSTYKKETEISEFSKLIDLQTKLIK